MTDPDEIAHQLLEGVEEDVALAATFWRALWIGVCEMWDGDEGWQAAEREAVMLQFGSFLVNHGLDPKVLQRGSEMEREVTTIVRGFLDKGEKTE